MPYDSGGIFSLVPSYKAIAGQTIRTAQHNPPLEDLASGMSSVLVRDGRAGMVGNLSMGGFAITNLKDGVATTDGATVGQVPGALASVAPSLAAKTVPADADLLVISDSADSNNPKKLSWANLRAALQRIVSSAAGTLFTLESTEVGSSSGPGLDLFRNSASPAANDVLGEALFSGKDSAGNTEVYAALRAILKSATNGSEAGELVLRSIVAGVLADRLHIGAGAYMDGATGGDPGSGKVNATGYQVNGKAFWGAPDVLMQDQKPSGTAGGTFTSGAWQTRDLNTIVYNPSSLMALSSNQFTPTVDGYVKWSCPALNPNNHKTRLYNVTDSAEVTVGSNAWANDGPGVLNSSFGGGPVTGGKTYRIEHRGARTQSSNGFGQACGFGNVEVYTIVEFWRAG